VFGRIPQSGARCLGISLLLRTSTLPSTAFAATLATDIDPATSSEEALWAELDRLTPTFLARWRTISAGASLPEAAEGPSLLELCRELTYRMLAHCNFCPWSRGIGLETVKTALAAGHSVRALPR